jgi:hypothetical protein
MDQIGIQEVIDQVKRELLASNPAAQARDPYPLFAIEKIELEIATRITRSQDGSIKLTVLEVAELGAGRSTSQEHSHVVRVSLAPLLSREELIAEALKDDTTRRMVQQDARRALVRHNGGLLGEPE